LAVLGTHRKAGSDVDAQGRVDLGFELVVDVTIVIGGVFLGVTHTRKCAACKGLGLGSGKVLGQKLAPLARHRCWK